MVTSMSGMRMAHYQARVINASRMDSVDLQVEQKEQQLSDRDVSKEEEEREREG